MILARLLTPREFGVAAASAFFMQLAGRLFEFGFNATLVRSKTIEPIQMSTIFVTQLVVGVAMYFVMVTLAPWIGTFFRMPEATTALPVAALAWLIGPWGSIPSALLQRRFEYQKSTTVDWVQLLVTSVTNVAFAMLGYGYMSIIYGRLSSSVAAQAMVEAVTALSLSERRLSALREFRVFDVYRLPPNSSKITEASANVLLINEKSLAFRLVLQDTERPVTDADADAAVKAVLEVLEQQFAARLRH
jgi:O-antigen/teichoic acid export membrane protein